MVKASTICKRRDITTEFIRLLIVGLELEPMILFLDFCYLLP